MLKGKKIMTYPSYTQRACTHTHAQGEKQEARETPPVSTETGADVRSPTPVACPAQRRQPIVSIVSPLEPRLRGASSPAELEPPLLQNRARAAATGGRGRRRTGICGRR